MIKSWRVIIFSVILVPGCITNCKSAQKTQSPGEVSKVEIEKIRYPENIQKEIDKFLTRPKKDNEHFRILASSEYYQTITMDENTGVSLSTDSSANEQFGKDLDRYNMFDKFSTAVFKVTLYRETMTISKIRPVIPADIRELNKMIADDITRLKFQLKDETSPIEFLVSYGIILQKKMTSEEIKKFLKERTAE